jgi:hypothetical protein
MQICNNENFEMPLKYSNLLILFSEIIFMEIVWKKRVERKFILSLFLTEIEIIN